MKTLIGILFCSITLIASTQIDNGLVAKYSFNAGNANDEIGTNDGVVDGASLTIDRFGNPNAAYKFDGIDDYIDFGDDAAFQFGWNDFSYSIWFKLDTAQYSALFGKASLQSLYSLTFGGDDIDPLNISSTTLCRMMHKENNDFRTVNKLENDTTTWHHAVVVHRYNDSTSLFIDNQFIGSENTSYQNGLDGFNITGNNLFLGRHSIFSIFFRGKADDIRMYDRAISVVEVDSLFNMPNTLDLNILDKSAIKVFPNPASNVLHIKGIEASSGSSFQIFSIDGQKVLEQTSLSYDSIELDITSLLKGAYLIKIQTEQDIHALRFLKD